MTDTDKIDQHTAAIQQWCTHLAELTAAFDALMAAVKRELEAYRALAERRGRK